MQRSHYDVVIIGCGLSGLAAGIRLAHFGKKVLILEKHNAPGGLNSFYSIAGRKYDVGLHAVTNYVPRGTKGGTPLMRVLRQLRIDWEDFALIPQKTSRIQFPGVALNFNNDFQTLEASVAAAFPKSIEGFRKMVSVLPTFDEALFHPNRSTSGRAFLKTYLQDPVLIDMLLCALCYYGSAREDDIDFSQLAVLFRSILMEGFARPAEGIRRIIRALLDRYRQTGGERRMKCAVTALNIKAGRVASLTLSTGEVLTADTVLSSIGAVETFNLLSEKPEATKPPTPGALSFVEALSHYPLSLTQGLWEETIVFFSDDYPFRYRAPKELIDPGSGVICLAHNYAFTGEDIPTEGCLRVTALAHPHAWHKLDADTYAAEKEKTAQALLAKARTYLPPLPTLGEAALPILALDTFTPKTIERFTGHLRGTVYGSPEKLYNGQTPVTNLLLCGTDQGLLGIVGAMLSGIIQSGKLM